MTDLKACSKPLYELLEAIPVGHRLDYESTNMAMHCIPVGIHCHEAAKELRKARTPDPLMEWQPIETAPKDDEATKLLITNGFLTAVCWYSEYLYEWCITKDDNDYGTESISGATHWMPLPKPPLLAKLPTKEGL